MKKTTLAIVALATMLFAAGCGSNDKTADQAGNKGSAGESGSAPKTLVMATSADYPPYESVDIATDEIVGFDIDIAKYMANKLGYKLTIKNSDFDGLLPAMQAGRADFVMAGMTPDDKRRKNADFTDIYFQAQNTIVSNKSEGYKTWDELSGKKVGVQLGSTQEAAAKEQKGLQLKSLNRIPDLVQELKTGRIDAAIIEDTVAKGYTKTQQELVYQPIPTEDGGSAIALPKNSKLTAQMNDVLKEMKENGEMDKLVVKWFGS